MSFGLERTFGTRFSRLLCTRDRGRSLYAGSDHTLGQGDMDILSLHLWFAGLSLAKMFR